MNSRVCGSRPYNNAEGYLDVAHPESMVLGAHAPFLDENLVRAISLRYVDNGDPARSLHLQETMMQEYQTGYTLEPFFYAQLSGYEKSNESLSEYCSTMLKHLSVKDGLTRWEQATKSRPK
jgi:hypothetical protein